MTDRPTQIQVLVVDDSEDFLGTVCSWIETQPRLRLAGTAGNGLEALDALGQSTPDLVLMDAIMPGLDGFEATRRIKGEAGAPLVVMLSVHEGSAVEREAWAAGADGFVPKSELADVLPGVIRALVSGRAGSPDGGPDQRRPSGESDGPAPRRPERRSPPEKSAERRAEDGARLTAFLRRIRARLDVSGQGTNRRPVVVSARSQTEGGIS